MRLLFLRLFFVVSMVDPILALQPVAANEQRSDPADQGEAAKEAPCQSLALGMDVRRERKEAAGDEGPDAAAEGR